MFSLRKATLNDDCRFSNYFENLTKSLVSTNYDEIMVYSIRKLESFLPFRRITQ